MKFLLSILLLLALAVPASASSISYEMWTALYGGGIGTQIEYVHAPWTLRYWTQSGLDAEEVNLFGHGRHVQTWTFDVARDVGLTTIYAGVFSLRPTGYVPLDGGAIGIRGTVMRYGRTSITYDFSLLASRLPGYYHRWTIHYDVSDTQFAEFGARKFYFHLPTDFLTWDGWSVSMGWRF